MRTMTVVVSAVAVMMTIVSMPPTAAYYSSSSTANQHRQGSTSTSSTELGPYRKNYHGYVNRHVADYLDCVAPHEDKAKTLIATQSTTEASPAFMMLPTMTNEQVTINTNLSNKPRLYHHIANRQQRQSNLNNGLQLDVFEKTITPTPTIQDIIERMSPRQKESLEKEEQHDILERMSPRKEESVKEEEQQHRDEAPYYFLNEVVNGNDKATTAKEVKEDTLITESYLAMTTAPATAVSSSPVPAERTSSVDFTEQPAPAISTTTVPAAMDPIPSENETQIAAPTTDSTEKENDEVDVIEEAMDAVLEAQKILQEIEEIQQKPLQTLLKRGTNTLLGNRKKPSSTTKPANSETTQVQVQPQPFGLSPTNGIGKSQGNGSKQEEPIFPRPEPTPLQLNEQQEEILTEVVPGESLSMTTTSLSAMKATSTTGAS